MDSPSSGDGVFEIKVEFKRGKGEPARVFRTMTGLIESIQALDQHLSATLSTRIRTKLLLQDIEAGSLISKLVNIIEDVPDEALKEGDYKKVIGQYLHRAKHKILDWCSKRNEIKDRGEIKELQGEIVELAKETDIKRLPAYPPIESGTLLSDMSCIRSSLDNLEETDAASLTSDEGTSQFNKSLVFSDDVVRELMTRETIVSKGERILKVKKPDYLGSSKWLFKHSGYLVDAKISDEAWLRRFQTKVVSVQPGDSLRAIVREETLYGYDSEIVRTNYEILEVLEVIPAPKVIQENLF